MRSASVRPSMSHALHSAAKKVKTLPNPSADEGTSVHSGRVRVLRERRSPEKGPVVYWMFRDQRSRDNWALIHAVDQAAKMDTSVAVAFNLFDRFLGAKARHFGFMLRGLRQLQQNLEALGIPFFLFQARSSLSDSTGEAADTIPRFLDSCNASLLVVDFSPLRDVRRWKDEILAKVDDVVAVHEVDAHNVVPIWAASEKLEYSAKTIRAKIRKLLPEYLVEFPTLYSGRKWMAEHPAEIDWEMLTANVLREGADVPELEWCKPGEHAAMEVLMGSSDGFLTTRLKNYASDRNNPLKPKALSRLSPYLHFGQISAQRCALEANKFRKMHPQSVDVFLEEMIVRRELADNFCFYQPNYDSLQGAWEWARKTLMDHAADKRDHVYTTEQLEKAKTADTVSRSLECVSVGNGSSWKNAWIHEGWRERPVFGKIRYMNYAGCKRKFDVDGYISYVKRLIGKSESKKRKVDNTPILLSKENPKLPSLES
ncbi:hypothetical protein ACLOJK_005381 [Asimina triloba]